MGELLDGKPTNHLDIRKPLAHTTAGAFLYYTVASYRDAGTLMAHTTRDA